jgi:signal transduction histidine kinase
LAQILLFGETLALGRTRGDGERRLAARTIVEEARRLMRMVDNILVFSRIRRAPITPCAERVDLWRLACEVSSGFEPLAAARGARVDVGAGMARGHAGVWEVAADPWLVRQILLNLLDNAVKHGREGQVVRVALSGDAAQVRLTVDDEGPGVPAADRERIWDPYVRLPEGGGGQEGSGLGLAVVRDLAAALGGRVWVEDGARGGARFGLSLPRGLAVERGAPPAEESTPDAGPFPHHSNAPRTHSTPSQPSTT